MTIRNAKKNQRGFTLVEVIVVAVIVAALAAVAVPLYLGYVDSSRRNAAANAAGSVASFAGACRNSAGTVATAGGSPAVPANPTATPPTEAIPATPATSVTCSSNGSTIQIPTGISITVTQPVGAAAGSVVGCHTTFDCTQAANQSAYSY